MSQPDQKTIQSRELLAFQLFSHSLADAKPSEKTRQLWQEAEEESRKGFRDMAKAFTDQLDQWGLGVRVSNSSELEKSLKWLLTIPARPAYSLPPIPAAPPV